MNYIVTLIGDFDVYKPEVSPYEGIPLSAAFAQRRGDGADWYVLINDPNFRKPNTVLATLMLTSIGYLVQAVQRDPSMLFPGGQRLVEIAGVDEAIEKPHKLFEQQICDIEAGTFTPQTPPVPPLTARQLRLALVGEGISLSSVSAIIAAIADDKARETAQIEWEYAIEYRRDHPLIASLGTALNMTEADIDRLWKEAQAL